MGAINNVLNINIMSYIPTLSPEEWEQRIKESNMTGKELSIGTEPSEPSQTIFFLQTDGKQNEILKLCQNGDIFVKGKLIKNDTEVVYALREFLQSAGYLR